VGGGLLEGSFLEGHRLGRSILEGSVLEERRLGWGIMERLKLGWGIMERLKLGWGIMERLLMGGGLMAGKQLDDLLVRSGVELNTQPTEITEEPRSTSTEAPVRPRWAFTFYFGLVCAAGLTALIAGLIRGDLDSGSPWIWIAFITLFALAERGAVFFHLQRQTARFGLSVSEALLLVMLVALSTGQLIWAVTLGVAIEGLAHKRRDPLKILFNSAQAGVSAAAAIAVTHLIEQLAPGSTPVRLLAGAIGVAIYAALTHLLVAGAIVLTESKKFFRVIADLLWASGWNLGLSALLGLLFAAAYLGTHWALLLFPIATGGLSLAYAALMRQSQDRERVESLHAASRSLAMNPDLRDALTAFLKSVASAVSGMGATAIVPGTTGQTYSSVYGDAVAADMEDAEGTALAGLLESVRQAGGSIVSTDATSAACRALGARDLIAVPVRDAEETIGCLVVVDRVGAETWGDPEVRLLEALSNELTLSLESHRLFLEVTEERERFQLLVEGVRDYAMYMMDPDGIVVSWNAGAERQLGYRADEIVGRHVSGFYLHEDMANWQDELVVAEGLGRSESEGRRVRVDGSTFLVNELINPVRDADGALRGYVAVSRDITEIVRAREERESLETQLHQAQKLESIGQLAGGIAHDFNNLLSVILNCSQFVLEESGESLGDTSLADLREVKLAAQRAQALTRQLLVFSRRDIVELKILDLNEVVSNVEQLLKRSIGENVILRTELDDGIATIKADSGKLEQVILNLAVNARDAMTGSGTITIETSDVLFDESDVRSIVDIDPGRYVRLSVSDTGSGMPDDVIQKAFDPFFTTKPKGRGTGLGLATVYGIVTGAGGSISIRSELGRGTTFLMHFPVALGPEDQPEEVEALSTKGNGETILLVEDEDAVRAVTRRILANGGYEVVEASNAEEAIARVDFADTPIDLVLSDVVMPGASGLELVDNLRLKNHTVKAIFMSGYSDALVDLDSEAADAPILLQKPFGGPDLLAKVREVLNGPS
jgi:PAS domain S-box-containing protein